MYIYIHMYIYTHIFHIHIVFKQLIQVFSTKKKEKLYKLFEDFGFRLDVTTDLKITDYLDITLNLYSGTVSPFRKRNQDLRYVKRGSNHPIQVFKHIPKGIEHR